MPYSRWDKVRRLLWTIVWRLLARPLLRSAAGDDARGLYSALLAMTSLPLITIRYIHLIIKDMAQTCAEAFVG